MNTSALKRVVIAAALVGVLGGLGIFFFRPASTRGVASAVAVLVAEPPRDLRAPVLTGFEVRRDALNLRDGKRYVKGASEPFTGLMTEIYGNGVLQSRSVISNGLLEGLSEGWYTNGTKQVEELFSGDVSSGLRVKWYENGKKLSETPIVAGKIEGVFKRWHDNGVLAEEISLRSGVPDGLSRSYYPDGCRKAEAHLSNGTVVDQKSWTDGEFH
jgi:antitoxin component YwqK of YwqJK toxin-antitoxin module